MQKIHTLIIGSGAAGLCAAVRLHAEGICNLLIVTEGLDKGTSINTGSDKQTYYKLSLCGCQTDSPREMAETLFNGGSMHGDIALVEAALSARAFHHLVNLGVKFPTDSFGQFVGYKTDHDPRQRATSVGPYTSRDMCLVLIQRVRELQIPVQEQFYCVKLLKQNDRVCGAIFLNEKGQFVPIIAENIVFAVGGPGGLYENSVYPKCHTGSIGLALAIGAEARNLPESQFGLASTKFRWNVSGTYMQVIPRFVSTDINGNDVQEFLVPYFDSTGELCSKIFLKGYQWPFDVKKIIGGSSLIDLFVFIETVQRQRRVFLDFRDNPQDFEFRTLSTEAFQYLEKSGVLFGKPIDRLEKMNPSALELYARHGIDLGNEMLEIAVCAQHNNGGLAGTIWWESVNIKHLFPVGEVNGSHGVSRPGGSALNSGQVGAFRAAEYIANGYSQWTLDIDSATKIAEAAVCELEQSQKRDENDLSYKDERRFVQKLMSEVSFIRNANRIAEAKSELRRFYRESVQYHDWESIQTRNLALTGYLYLDAIYWSIIESGTGSRGSGLVLGTNIDDQSAIPVHLKLDTATWKMQPENELYRKQVLASCYDPTNCTITHHWEPCRPIPETDSWFETVWKNFREKKIY